MTTVAVLGMGRMGGAMAANLGGSGFDVIVWNRTSGRAESAAEGIGATVVGSPAEAARRADIVVSSLADDDAVRTVHLGDEGTVAGSGPSTVVLETSTVDPTTITELAPRFADTGARLLDAPVSGSVSLVEQGQLTFMVGGDSEAIDRASAVIDTLSARSFHLGESGSGATMKLAVNSLVHATNLALSEALVLAERAGIDRSRAYEVLASGAGGSPFVQYKRQAFEHPDDTPVAFSLDLVRKDLELILALAERHSVPLDQGLVTASVTERAITEGLGSSDMSALAVYLRRKAAEA